MFYWAIFSELVNVMLGCSQMEDQDLLRPDAFPAA